MTSAQGSTSVCQKVISSNICRCQLLKTSSSVKYPKCEFSLRIFHLYAVLRLSLSQAPQMTSYGVSQRPSIFLVYRVRTLRAEYTRAYFKGFPVVGHIEGEKPLPT